MIFFSERLFSNVFMATPQFILYQLSVSQCIFRSYNMRFSFSSCQISSHNPGSTVCISRFSRFSVFLDIFQVIQILRLIFNVFQFFSTYSRSYILYFSFFTFFNISSHIPGPILFFFSHFEVFQYFPQYSSP